MESANGSGSHVIVADTNIFVHDPTAVNFLREKEGTILCIPICVLYELDNLKDRPDIGGDAREAARWIEEALSHGDGNLLVFKESPSFKSLEGLNRNKADHIIIAVAAKFKNNKKYSKVTLISRDRMVRVIARQFGIDTESYDRDSVNETPGFELRNVDVKADDIHAVTRKVVAAQEDEPAADAPEKKKKSKQAKGPRVETITEYFFPYDPEICGSVLENEGVVCTCGSDLAKGRSYFGKRFPAVRKGNMFRLISPDISAFGLHPLSVNGNGPNWWQMIALSQLLDPSINLIFLQGGAGSGKTLLAMAAAIESRRFFKRIIVGRPMVHLEDEDKMGFLPGDVQDKLSPWLIPIGQALDILKSDAEKVAIIKDMEYRKKISYVSLDYIRGMTFHRTYLIVDEAQNLTPHQIRTVVTRAGMGTKVVFTGDLGQIDRKRRMDRHSSGLAFAINRMTGRPIVGTIIFRDTVRSPLASLAEELL